MVDALTRGAYNQDDRQILEYSVDRNAKILLRVLNCVLELGWISRTHETFRASVNDTDQQETDREPLFGVLQVKIPKRDYPNFLDNSNASTANG